MYFCHLIAYKYDIVAYFCWLVVRFCETVMLKANLRQVFESRGVKNPLVLMQKWGISRPTAWNLLDNRVKSISFRHLELICERLNCTPNDLYAWTPGAGVGDVEGHPLRGLMRDDSAADLVETLKELPLDKLKEARELLASLRNSD